MSLATGVNRGGGKKKKNKNYPLTEKLFLSVMAFTVRKISSLMRCRKASVLRLHRHHAFFFFFNFALHTLTAKLRNEREEYI